MKKLLLLAATLVVAVTCSYAQGRFYFNNSTSGGGPVTVGTLNMGATGGAAGSFLGSPYSIEVLYAAGTFADQASFNAAAPTATAATAFFGAGPAGEPNQNNGAGIYDFGPQVLVTVPTTGIYTVQARAWFNNGQFATFGAAASAPAGANTGLSGLVQVNAKAAPAPADSAIFSGFTVGVVPEPSTFALIGLGMGALVLIRRKK